LVTRTTDACGTGFSPPAGHACARATVCLTQALNWLPADWHG